MSFAEKLASIADSVVEKKKQALEPLIEECANKLEYYIRESLERTAGTGRRSDFITLRDFRFYLKNSDYDKVLAPSVERVFVKLGVECVVDDVKVDFNF